jgi:predicted enzyme related to lactoylglutathione lyase
MASSSSPGAVIYAKDVARVSGFYAAVTGLRVAHADDEYVVLESEGFQLVVHGIPAEVIASLELAEPPLRREDATVKLVFPVPSISAARAVAATYGGKVDPPEREWRFQSDRVCDGHDPEGNVVQLRERAL